MSADSEIRGLVREHEVISAHVTFLAESLSKLAMQPGRGAAQPGQVKSWLENHRWSLYDFREGIRRHIELDERIFRVFPRAAAEETVKEHEVIRKDVDDAIRLADRAIENESREDLDQLALDLKEAVNRICELILSHIAKEDKLLRRA